MEDGIKKGNRKRAEIRALKSFRDRPFLTLEGECIREELYTYFGRNTDVPSKAAFYKQIRKLKNGALRRLLLHLGPALHRPRHLAWTQTQ